MNLALPLEFQLPSEYYQRIQEVSALAESMNLTPYLVGGAVRDLILRAPFRNDCDMTFTGGSISRLAETLAKKWNFKHLNYAQFETHTLLSSEDFHLDLITARSETYSKPGALPKIARGDLNSDLERRDFTVNAMALDLTRKNWGKLIDPLGGLQDLKQKTIRVLHRKSFVDDPTRIFRAARYAGRFGFKLELQTEKFVRSAIGKKMIQQLSGDRIRTEIEKILIEENPSKAVSFLSKWNALRAIHPQIGWSSTIAKTMNSTRTSKIQNISAIAVRMALWLAQNSGFTAESVLERLNFTKDVRDRIAQPLLLHIAFQNSYPMESIPVSSLYPETSRVFEALISVNKSSKGSRGWKSFQKWMSVKPELSGRDLQKMGFKPGPVYKEILMKLRLKKYRGALSSKEDEMRFVIDNYRRN